MKVEQASKLCLALSGVTKDIEAEK